MGHYKIHLFPGSYHIMSIVTDFGTFRYNRVSVGLYTFRDILKLKQMNSSVIVRGSMCILMIYWYQAKGVLTNI